MEYARPNTTYIKCHRKHLDPRTLDRFGLPWEWEDDDEDADYLLIKQYIDEDLQEQLFEHTRQLRWRNRSHGQDLWNDVGLGYTPPKCIETGVPLSSDINLKLPNVKSQATSAKAVLIPDDLPSGSINVTSSRVLGDNKVVLYRKDASTDSQAVQFSWVHMEKVTKSFDEFARFAASVPGLADEDVAVILSLLKKVRQNEKSAYSGKYLQPTVLRCDGRDPSGLEIDQRAGERSATFICFPYYSVESMPDTTHIPVDSSMHRTRSLLQTFYNLESTGKRDLEQVVQKTGIFPKNHILCIPQLWAIILNSRLVITSAPVFPFRAAKHSLQISDPPKAHASSSPSVIRVNDPRQRTFFLPMEQCKTWFALMDKISHHCLADYDLQQYDCELFTSDNILIRSEDWQTLITSQTSPILSLHARLVSPVPPHWEDDYSDYKSDSRSGDIDRERVFLKAYNRQNTKDSSGSYTRKSTMQRTGTTETYRDRRGTTMALVKRVPTWDAGGIRKREKDYESDDNYGITRRETDDNYGIRRERDWRLTRYRGSNDRRRNHIAKYPLPSSSGIVVNKVNMGEKKGSSYASTGSDIYFNPKRTTTTRTGSFRGYQLNQHSRESRKAPTSDSKPTFDRAPAGGKPFSESPKNTSSSDIKLHVPPVFTWPVGNRSETSHHSEGDNSSEHGGEGPNKSEHADGDDTNAQQRDTMVDPSQEEEETLDNVSNHINSQLLEMRRYDEDIYGNTATISLFDLEKTVKDVLKTSVLELMSRRLAESLETGDDTPIWRADMKRAASMLFKIFDYFIPLAYPCDVADKYWGAVHDIVTAIPKMCDASKDSGRAGQAKKSNWFTVVDLSDSREVDLRHPKDLRLLTREISDCSSCRSGQHYSSRSEALEHLLANHFTISSGNESVISPNWVMDYEQCLNFKLRRDGQSMLNILIDHGSELERLGLEIQHGVSENGRFDRKTYRIPSSLVDSFRDLLMMVVLAGHAAKKAYRNWQEYDSIDMTLSFSFISNSLHRRFLQCGSGAEACMEDAKREIVLMTYTDDSSDIVSYEAVSPELVLALVMGDIRSRDSRGSPINIIEIYQNHLLKLQFKVNQHPHRRLLQEIHYVVEELEILRYISKQQRLILGNYRQILNPFSLRVTTESRISAFAVEKDRLIKLGVKVDDELEAINTLIEKAESLSVQTQRGVEVRQEDHGKAILAFTIVTVIFLPLSFVTSFFGMNTTDIRDTTSSQYIFWAIAAPLTVVMITVTLLVGFKGDAIREMIIDSLSKKDPQTRRQRTKNLGQTKNGMVQGEENADSDVSKRWWRVHESDPTTASIEKQV